jgi:hypothetical protein
MSLPQGFRHLRLTHRHYGEIGPKFAVILALRRMLQPPQTSSEGGREMTTSATFKRCDLELALALPRTAGPRQSSCFMRLALAMTTRQIK